jgi:hypothetical protein
LSKSVKKSCQKVVKVVKKLSISCQKIVKKLSKKYLVKNLSKMFVKNLSIICPFAQIVRGRRRRRRRLVAPRPDGDFVAPGKNHLPNKNLPFRRTYYILTHKIGDFLETPVCII